MVTRMFGYGVAVVRGTSAKLWVLLCLYIYPMCVHITSLLRTEQPLPTRVEKHEWYLDSKHVNISGPH